MWTHSGIFIEKIGSRLVVYASDIRELEEFSDEGGELRSDLRQMVDIKEDGLYQCLIGYGSMSTPIIYFCKKIAKINWDAVVDEMQGTKKIELRDEIDIEILHKEIERVLGEQ
jgi:hypothetical protein